MTFQPVPKPAARSESEKRVDALTKAWKRKDRWRAKAIAKAKGKPRTKVKQRNEKRIAKKHAAYRKVIASAFHKELRYKAFMRSRGLCECEQCVMLRLTVLEWGTKDWQRAFTPIPVWFSTRGANPWLRFRSTEGELHHTGNYRYFGEENPAEIDHVLWVHKVCHRRIEAQFGTRRRYLSGRK